MVHKRSQAALARAYVRESAFWDRQRSESVSQVSKVDAFKEIIRAWGMNPEQLLAKEALTQGAITHINSAELENQQLNFLANQLKELIKKEATA